MFTVLEIIINFGNKEGFRAAKFCFSACAVKNRADKL
jgi:hypothetical protein